MSLIDLSLTELINMNMFASTPYRPQRMPAINQWDVNAAPIMDAYSFGQSVYSHMLFDGIGAEALYRDYRLGLGIDEALNGRSFLRIDRDVLENIKFDLHAQNPFNSAFGNSTYVGSHNFSFGLGSPNYGTQTGNVSDTTSKIDNSDKAKYNRKVRLIKKYASYEDRNIEFEEKLNKIAKEVGTDYKKGIQKLNEIIATFDETKAEKVVNDLFSEDLTQRLNNAKTYSTAWLNKIQNSTNGDYAVSFNGVTKDNILDILGTFLTESKTNLAGSNWNSLLKNNFTKITDLLYAKANDIKSKCCDSDKNTIDSCIAAIKSAGTDNEKCNACYRLFDRLRAFQLTNAQETAFKNYGLYDDNSHAANGGAEKSGYKQYYAEKNRYNNEKISVSA